MICIDMLTDEEQKKPDSIGKKWREGRLATQPGMATIALAVVLVLSILAAQLIVSARSEYTEAVQNGNNLIEQISEKGLSHYLPQHTIIRYYIIEEQSVPARFMVATIEPHLQGKSYYEINETRFNSQGWPLDHVRLVIDNQLTSYKYESPSYSFTKNPHGYYLEKHPIRILDESAQNLIPRQLLDFFSSVAAAENLAEGVILDIPDELILDRRYGYIFQTSKFWIKPGGEIPSEIQKAKPNGYSVHVKQLESRHLLDDTDSKPVVTRQDIYYDSQHQVVWKKDISSEEITRSVTPQELIEAFPNASVIIRDQWQNIKPKMDDPTDDEEEI